MGTALQALRAKGSGSTRSYTVLLGLLPMAHHCVPACEQPGALCTVHVVGAVGRLAVPEKLYIMQMFAR